MLSIDMCAFASFSLIFVLSAFACAPTTQYPDPTLSEKMGIELQLPMPEDEFLQLMNARSFASERRGAGSRFGEVPLSRDVDLESMGVVYAYMIDTGFNAPAGRVERYIAYVDANGDVILIEERFARVAP